MVRFHPQWLRARELVREGRIGELRAVQMFFCYKNMDPANIRNAAAIGGGALYDIGCYAVVAGRFFLEAEPARAIALIDRDPGFGTDRLTSALVDFGGGRHLDFTVSTQIAPHQRLQLCGTQGRIELHIPVNAPQGGATRHLDRRLHVAGGHRHPDRDASRERSVHAAGGSVFTGRARRDRVPVRRRGCDREHARHRRAVPLGKDRQHGRL